MSKIISKSGCTWDKLLTGRKPVIAGDNEELLEAKNEVIVGLKREIAALNQTIDSKDESIALRKDRARELEGVTRHSEGTNSRKTTEYSHNF